MEHPLPSLDVGESYSWSTLDSEEYFHNGDTGLGTGGGIHVKPDSKNPEYILLFSSDDGIYEDSVYSERFQYIGQGQPDKGDQDTDRYTNRSLIRAINEDIAVYFFHREQENDDWTFRGLVDVLDYEQLYRESEDRKVLAFTLTFNDSTATPQPSEESTEAPTIEVPADNEMEEPPNPNATEGVRDHVAVQYYLLKLGLEHGYDVYIAKNDQGETYNGTEFREICRTSLNLPGFSPEATSIIEYVDVIWLEDGTHIAKMFEVESTTQIYSGVLRMTDFVAEVPNLAVDMYIVAPKSDGDRVEKHMTRPTFTRVLDWADHCSLEYLSFDEVQTKHELVEENGPLVDLF